MKALVILVPLYIVAALVLGASVTAGIFVIHVVVAPMLFKYSKTFRRHLIFANIAKWPLNVDYDDPSASGIEGARNFNIEYRSKVDNCKIKIGVWHILPKSLYEKHKGSFEPNADKEKLSAALDAELVNSQLPIMIYCHGNSNTRAASHRVLLYKFFQKMDFHTIAFDYRGYADSTNVLPTEAGVVEDALIVYDWLNTTISKADTRPPVFVWGHSLGTGISSHLLGNLQRLSKDILERSDPLPLPNGLILEAPFNNIVDEVGYHPLAKLVRWLPYFDNFFVSPFRSAPEHEFKSDLHLTNAPTLPILILHSRDDVIVPHYVGKKLYEAVLKSRQDDHAPVILHSYPKQESLGHKYIVNAQDLPDVVGAILLTGASLTASVLVLQVAVLPLLFRYSKSVQRKMVFSNCINYPKNVDFEDPQGCNLMGCRNFYVEFHSMVDDCGIRLGVWHIGPTSFFRDLFVLQEYMPLDMRFLNELKKTNNTIVLYCHGNSNHRASPQRLVLYKVFQDLNYHVITFDYRGYGDSSHVRPTEKGVVEDVFQVYSWLIDALDLNQKPLVVLWGHSLGTAIAANLVSNLSELCRQRGRHCLPLPRALVLEAPFNNLVDEIESHPFSKLVSWLPYYKNYFVKPFTSSSEYTFATDQYLPRVPELPVLMLHSKGDRIVPCDLAVKLYDSIARSRAGAGAPLQFHVFDRGHNNLCEAPDLPRVVTNFLKTINKEKLC